MRVDLFDPGSEGLALEAILRAAGHDVRAGELGSLHETEADVVVLAGDAPGALEALRRLRDDGQRPDALVVLVGAPAGVEPRGEGPAFGAEWALSREVAPDRLVRVVFEVAARAQVEKGSGGPRERTLDLGRDESAVARVHDDGGPRRVARISDVAPSPEPGSGEHVLRAPISLELEAILRAGAERAFPGALGVDVSLPAGEEAAADLVPDDFVAAGRLDEVDDEPAADSLTFVGGPPPVTAPRAARTSATPASVRASSPPPRPESDKETRAPLSTASHAPRPRLSSPPPRPDRGAMTTGAEGPIAGAGSVLELLRTLFSLAGGEAKRLRIQASGIDAPPPIELAIEDGLAVEIGADVARRVLSALGQRPAASETEAEARLDALVLGGLVSRARRAREGARAGRGLLDALLAAERFEWAEIERGDRRHSTRALPEPFVREVADASARAIGPHRSSPVLEARARLAPTPRWRALAPALGASIELEAALGEGASQARLVMALEDEPGLWGRLLALLAAGAVSVVGHDAEVPDDFAARARARASIEDAARLAQEGDYFSLLGLGHRASAAEVEAAFRERDGRLRALDLDALDLGALAADRELALDALAESRRVLGRDSWRTAYAAALARG